LEPQSRCRKLDRVFKIAGLRLKLVRTEVHALRPHHLGQRSHRAIGNAVPTRRS
jgi:hypothetical protein